jgi:hypothetical protein
MTTIRPSDTMHPWLVPEQKAAKAVGIPLATFRHLVAKGLLPKPLPEFGLYDRKAIDAALGRLSGIGAPGNTLDTWRARRAN